MSLSLRFGAVSDIGRSRKKNDDSGYAGPHLLMVADGMGGAPAGDVASSVVIHTMQRLDAPPSDDLLEALAGAVHRANDRLGELIEEEPDIEGSGTTVSAVLFDGARIGVAHLGDSRGYLWRDGVLLPLTHDHTWVQSLVDEGRITEDEAKVHSHRSLLLKVLDGRHDNDPDLAVHDVQAGDRILLCSDGLSGFVEHDRMARVLSIGTAPVVAAELVQLALEAESNDNVTVVVGDVVETPEEGVSVGPLVVGAAASDPQHTPRSRLRPWAHREPSEAGAEPEVLIEPGADPEELRYAPRAPKRFRWLRRGLVLIAVLAVIGLVLKLSYDWTQDQYYVAADGEQIAIYRGVQAELPAIHLQEVYETQDLTLAELPSFPRSQVQEGMTADSLSDARAIVGRLHGIADTCAQQLAASSASTSSTPTSTPRPSRTPDASTTRKPGGSKPTTAAAAPESSTPPDDSETEDCAGLTDPVSTTS